MENSMVRQRYRRRTVVTRRHKRVPQAHHTSLRQIVGRQLIVCLILLVMIGIMKNIHISATNFITDQIKYVLTYNIELKNVFTYMDKLAADIRNSIAKVADDEPADDNPVTSAEDKPAIIEAVKPSDTDDSKLAALKKETVEANSSIENEAAVEDSDTEEVVQKLETAVLSASSEFPSDTYNMLVPVEGTLSTLYGERADTITGNRKMHKGIDITVKKGSNVKAVLDGVVVASGSSPEYGVFTEIRHSDNLKTVYANCYSLTAKEGDNIKRGDIIASMGDTGAAVGVHLHFEVWVDGAAVDPLGYINVPVR